MSTVSKVSAMKRGEGRRILSVMGTHCRGGGFGTVLSGDNGNAEEEEG